MKKDIIYSLLLLTFISCDPFDTLRGTQGISTSIEESKDRKVFIYEYHPIVTPVIINDTISFNIKRAWLEQQWGYGKNQSTVKQSGSQVQLIVKTDLESVENYGIDVGEWFIGENEYKPFVETGRWGWFLQNVALRYKLDTLPQRDTISWEVKTGNRYRARKVEGVQKVIGQFKLYKK